MKTNVIVQNTVPSAILKKVIGTIWIRPLNASLYTINEHGRMHRLSLYLDKVNYRESYTPGLSAFDDMLSGLRGKLASEGNPIGRYMLLIQSLREDAINLLLQNPTYYYQRWPSEIGTYKPVEFYESQSVAEFMENMFLSAAKYYNPSLAFETLVNSKYLISACNNGNQGLTSLEISNFLLTVAEACRIYSNFPDALTPHFLRPTVIQGNIDPNMNEIIPYLTSIFDRVSTSISYIK